MIRILADDLLMALGDHNPEVTHYLDRQTGALIPLFSGMFDPEDPEFIDEGELLADPRYLAVEPVSSDDAFRWMEDFAAGVDDPAVRHELNAALARRRPFRGFKDALLAFPSERDAWFEYQAARLLEAAREWLSSEGIEAELITGKTPGLEEPSPPASR